MASIPVNRVPCALYRSEWTQTFRYHLV